MNINRETTNSYIIPILSSLLVLGAGLVLSNFTDKISFVFFILAIVLFVIIGVAVYLAEIYRINRVSYGDITIQTIKNLLVNEKQNIGNATTYICSLEELMTIENSSKEIWIYAYDLAWELNNALITEAVYQNAKKGINYKYIIPNETKIIERVKLLTEKYKKLGLNSDVLKYKKRLEDLKFIRFGVIIYNPTISGANVNGEDCTVVFFPRFSEYKDDNDDIFLCLKGSQTTTFQEDFHSMWQTKTEHL